MRYIAMSLLVALLFTAALYAEPNLPEPVALPEPVYLVTEATVPVPVEVPVPVDHRREAAIEYAADLQAMADARLNIGEFEFVEAVLIATSKPEPPGPVWMPPVFAPPSAWPVSVEFWRPWVAVHPWPVDEALAIIDCESGGDSQIVSRTNDWGLFQMHFPYWYARAEKAGYKDGNPLDPATNIAVAYWLWNSKGGKWSGERGWTCGTILGLS